MVRFALSAVALAAAVATAAAAAEPRTAWQVSLWGKPRAFTEHVRKLAEIVAFRSGGRFTIALRYDLSPSRQNLDGIAAGRFEMAQFCAGYHPEKNRAITVMELPFLGIETLEEELAVSRVVYEHPETVAEMAQWNAKLLMPTPLPQYNLVGVGAAPRAADWFAGKRIRATGGIGRAFRALGAEPESLTATETYGALAAAELDAVAFAQHAHFSFDTISLAEWWTTNLNPGSVNCPVVVNSDAYAALPEAHRAILDAAVEPALEHYLLNYADLIGKWNVVLETFEVPTVTLDRDTLAALREAAAGEARAGWLADMEAAGLPGEELLALVESSLAAVRQGALAN